MNYDLIPYQAIRIVGSQYFLLTDYQSQDKTYSTLRSADDFKIISKIEFDANVAPTAILDNEIVFYNHTDNGYYLYNFRSLTKQKIDSNLILEYRWGKVDLLLQKSIGYQCRFNNHIYYSFSPKKCIDYKWCKSGILEIFKRDKEYNWIRCTDPTNGSEKWNVSYEWKISECYLYKGLLLVKYLAYENIRTDKGYEGQIHWTNPNVYTIAINIHSGEELWRKKFNFDRIDEIRGMALGKKDGEVITINLLSGNIQTQTPMKTESDSYFIHFSDKKHFYFTHRKGSFGKIEKQTGAIEWEFDLLDYNGKSRRLTEWFLLNNGNLVLKTMPHVEEKFMCVFNPSKNLKYSNIHTII